MKKISTTWVLKKIHRWLGFPLAVLFFITVVSGFLVGFDDVLEAFNHYGQSYTPVTLEEQAVALEKLTNQGVNYRQIILPSPSTPFYQIRARGERITYRIDDLHKIEHYKNNSDSFFSVMLRLHRNYLLGREGLFGIPGSEYSAWVGLLALLISIIALWLWWPLRKAFRLRDLLPNSTQRKDFYYSHMTAGIIVLIAIVLFSLTGAALTYRSVTQSLLNIDVPSTQGVRQTPLYTAANWQNWLRVAQAEIPDGHLQRIQAPRRRGGGNEEDNENLVNTRNAMEFRFVTSGDWLGMAGSKVLIDTEQSSLVGSLRFGHQSFSSQIYNMILPLHTGRNLSKNYLIVILVFMLLTAVMVFSGFISFIQKKRNYKQITQRKTQLFSTTFKKTSESRKPQNEKGRLAHYSILKNIQGFTMMQSICIVLISVSCSLIAVYLFKGEDINSSQTSQAILERERDGQNRGSFAEQSDNSQGSRGQRGMGSEMRSQGGRHQHGGGSRGGQRGSREGRGANAGHGQHSHSHGSGATSVLGFKANDLENSLIDMTEKLALNESQQNTIREVLSGYSEKSKSNRQTINNARQALSKLIPGSDDYNRNNSMLIEKAKTAFNNMLTLNSKTREDIYSILNETQQTIVTNIEAKSISRRGEH